MANETKRELLAEPVYLRIAVRDAGLLRALDKIVDAWAANGTRLSRDQGREVAASAVLEALAEKERW